MMVRVHSSSFFVNVHTKLYSRCYERFSFSISICFNFQENDLVSVSNLPGWSSSYFSLISCIVMSLRNQWRKHRLILNHLQGVFFYLFHMKSVQLHVHEERASSAGLTKGYHSISNPYPTNFLLLLFYFCFLFACLFVCCLFVFCNISYIEDYCNHSKSVSQKKLCKWKSAILISNCSIFSTKCYMILKITKLALKYRLFN